ncbi:protein HIRA-like [Branchiostoma floridae]|uniref:Protein HIRA n=1 Tax=Branchiostoma floridae TaxID=7739 RepID=A0A9J7N636_BRAFL|nr:protein HIRA-like [Branchiostoma floridae]
MKLLKPSWVTHDGKPIFSIDIHPDGSRFATGGQACVNCVRWSSDGRYLASGGDDKLIMIWQTGRYMCGHTTGPHWRYGHVVNIEQFRCVATLRTHTGDILDLAWSPQDAWLATCSIDNTIIVWNAQKFPEIISILKGHTGLVKGVTWDPVGKYLATQSDDKSLRVWRTVDWQQEAMVTKPFDECGGTTHVLRLAWSPDGQYIVSAHAMNNSGPTAQIIERQGFKTSMDFVGHRKAITVVRFNPNIFQKVVNKASGKSQQFSCCAIGSRDRSLSIWLTALKRPLVVVHDMFQNSVMDISWTPLTSSRGKSGFELLVCSWDGTAAYVEFTPEELGTPLTQDEMNSLHQRIYGKSMAISTQHTVNNTIIENPAMLKLQQQHTEHREKLAANKQVNGTPTKIKNPMLTSPTEKPNPKAQQIETRTPDGRRRITPLCIAPQVDFGDIPRPFMSSSLPMSSTGVAQSGLESAGTPRTSEPSQSSPSSQHATVKPLAQSMLTSVPASIPANIQPMKALDSRFTEKSKATSGTKAQSKPDKITPTTISTARQKDSDRPPVQDASAPGPTLIAKRKLDGLSQPGTKRMRKDKPALMAPAAPTQVTPTIPQDTITRSAPQPVMLRSPPAEKNISLQVGGEEETMVLELENNIQTAGVKLAGLKCRRGGKVEWETVLGTRGTLLAGSRKVLCVSCEDRSLCVLSPMCVYVYCTGRCCVSPVRIDPCVYYLPCVSIYVYCTGRCCVSPVRTDPCVYYLPCVSMCTVQDGAVCLLCSISLCVLSPMCVYVYCTGRMLCVSCDDRSLCVLSPSGRRLLPGLVLSHPTAILHCNGYHVMAVTTVGNLTVWNVQIAKVVIKNESLLPIMSGDVVIKTSSVTEQGVPVFSLSNGKVYTFSVSLGTWSTLSDVHSSLQQCSDHQAIMSSLNTSAQVKGPLASLQGQGQRSVNSLYSPDCYYGLEAQLREICDDLLGPVTTQGRLAKGSLWEPEVLGVCKRLLLGEVLQEVGSNLRLQRLYTEYQEQLDMVQTPGQ